MTPEDIVKWMNIEAWPYVAPEVSATGTVLAYHGDWNALVELVIRPSLTAQDVDHARALLKLHLDEELAKDPDDEDDYQAEWLIILVCEHASAELVAEVEAEDWLAILWMDEINPDAPPKTLFQRMFKDAN